MIKITLRTWAQVPFLVLTIAGMAGAQSYPNGSLIEENHSGDNGGFQSDYGTYANFEYSLYDNLVFKNNTAQGVGGAFALSGGGGLFLPTTIVLFSATTWELREEALLLWHADHSTLSRIRKFCS